MTSLTELEAKKEQLKEQLEAVQADIDRRVWQERPIHAGDRFVHKPSGEKFMVAQVDSRSLGLVSLKDGHLWVYTRSYTSGVDVTKSLDMFAGYADEFEPVLPEDKESIRAGIFTWLNLTNGKIIVGRSRNIHEEEERERQYLAEKTHWNQHFQNSWNLYGSEAFEFQIKQYLAPDASATDLNRVHQSWLDTFKVAGITVYNFEAR